MIYSTIYDFYTMKIAYNKCAGTNNTYKFTNDKGSNTIISSSFTPLKFTPQQFLQWMIQKNRPLSTCCIDYIDPLHIYKKNYKKNTANSKRHFWSAADCSFILKIKKNTRTFQGSKYYFKYFKNAKQLSKP